MASIILVKESHLETTLYGNITTAWKLHITHISV